MVKLIIRIILSPIVCAFFIFSVLFAFAIIGSFMIPAICYKWLMNKPVKEELSMIGDGILYPFTATGEFIKGTLKI